MGQILSDPACRFDKINAVVVVLFDAGGDGEDIRIENDILRRESNLIDQNIVGAFANFGLALEGIRLASFVECHDDDRSAMAACNGGLLEKFLLAFFHGNRIDDGLALNALQPGLDHREFRGIDHHRHTCNVGLRGDEVEECDHRLFGIEQAFVHVDVDDLRAVLDLIARNL